MFKKLLPQLQSLGAKLGSKPVVKYYEGKEGVRSMFEDFIKTAGKEVKMAYSVDAVEGLFSKEEKEEMRQKRIEKNIKTKVIYTYKNGMLQSSADGERRKVPLE